MIHFNNLKNTNNQGPHKGGMRGAVAPELCEEDMIPKNGNLHDKNYPSKISQDFQNPNKAPANNNTLHFLI